MSATGVIGFRHCHHKCPHCGEHWSHVRPDHIDCQTEPWAACIDCREPASSEPTHPELTELEQLDKNMRDCEAWRAAGCPPGLITGFADRAASPSEPTPQQQ